MVCYIYCVPLYIFQEFRFRFRLNLTIRGKIKNSLPLIFSVINYIPSPLNLQRDEDSTVSFNPPPLPVI